MDTNDLLTIDGKCTVGIYNKKPFVLERGLGARLWDKENKEYIDFGAGISVCSLGYQHPMIVSAFNEQANKLWHSSNYFHSEPPILLAKKLIEVSAFAKQVFLCNSGTEANEAAIKTIRKWAASQGKAPHQREILTFSGSFHGRTLAAITATAQPKYQQGFEPLPQGFKYAQFNDLSSVEALMREGNVAGVLLEPIQGESGIISANPDFLVGLRKLCDQHNVLLAFDEIQCGMMRTGKMFASHHVGVKPDLMTVAKALGSGLPIGALLIGDKCVNTLGPGDHGTTFGGNALASSVALKTLEVMESAELVENVAVRAEQIQQGIDRINQKYPIFKEVRGKGLMIGAVLDEKYGKHLKVLIDLAAQKGLLVLAAGTDVLRLLPPLIISKADVDLGLRLLEESVATFYKSYEQC